MLQIKLKFIANTFFASFVLILNNPLILKIGLLFSTYYSRFLLIQVFTGAPNENIFQNHLNIELLNVF